MRRVLQFVFSVISLLLLSGCATAYISSETDPRYKPVKTDPIHIVNPDWAPISTRKVAEVIRYEMWKNGFNVVPRDQALYLLIVNLDEKIITINSYLPIPQTSQTSGTIGSTSFQSTTTSTGFLPNSRSIPFKRIYATLYDVEDVNNSKVMSIWEGFISVRDENFAHNIHTVVREMLNHFGGNHEEHFNIEPNY